MTRPARPDAASPSGPVPARSASSSGPVPARSAAPAGAAGARPGPFGPSVAAPVVPGRVPAASGPGTARYTPVPPPPLPSVPPLPSPTPPARAGVRVDEAAVTSVVPARTGRRTPLMTFDDDGERPGRHARRDSGGRDPS